MAEGFLLADWLVDPRQGLLRRGEHEERLEPKVMAVLECLARRAGEVVSKVELLDEVWPDTHVQDVALARSVSELRRRFGDDARAPWLIETLPKRGYRLLVSPEPSKTKEPRRSAGVAEPGTSPLGQTREPVNPRPWLWLWLSILPMVVVLVLGLASLRSTDEPSVMVLPLRDPGSDPQAQSFGNGITEDLVTRLWRIEGLRVVDVPRSDPVAVGRRDPRALAEAARVATVLDGSVRRFDDRLRITVRLVEVDTGTVLWAEAYDRRPQDVFEVQNDIAYRIATALADTIELGGAPPAPTDRITAYELFHQGRDQYLRFDREGNEMAIDLYRQALDLDSDFARAHAELASALALRVADHGFPRSALEQARIAAETALALDPGLPEAHKAMALVHLVQGRPSLAHAEYRRALELRPDYREALEGIAYLQYQLGQWDEAGRWQLRRAPRLE